MNQTLEAQLAIERRNTEVYVHLWQQEKDVVARLRALLDETAQALAAAIDQAHKGKP
jgi:hypothetical protein